MWSQLNNENICVIPGQIINSWSRQNRRVLPCLWTGFSICRINVPCGFIVPNDRPAGTVYIRHNSELIWKTDGSIRRARTNHRIIFNLKDNPRRFMFQNCRYFYRRSKSPRQHSNKSVFIYLWPYFILVSSLYKYSGRKP